MAIADHRPLSILIPSILVELDIFITSFSIAVCTASWRLPAVTAPGTVFVHLLLAPQARPLYSLALLHPFFFGVLECGSLVSFSD
jgi:hypothetical protein